MNETDYKTILDEALISLGKDLHARADLDVAISKRKQFINATMNMLDDKERAFFIARLDEMAFDEQTRSMGLKEAMLRILRAEPGKWFSVTYMRDRLLESGFDFSGYSTNPLAAISTTLKRMTSKEAVKTTVEGVAAYRFRKPIKMFKPSASRVRDLAKKL